MTCVRLKIVLITAGCAPNAVGEAWSSFQWVSRISSQHDVTLLTYRKSEQPSIASYLPGIRAIEWTESSLFGRWERFNSMFKPGYLHLYVQARKWLKEALKVGETFDLIHQISPLALRYPSPAAGLGIPLVIGPLGGSLETPKAFRSEMKSAAWYTKLRCLDQWRLRHDPWLRQTYSCADRILCVAPYVQRLLGTLPSSETVCISETGVTDLPDLAVRSKAGKGPLRLLFVGRVIRTKGVRDAIRAMDKLKDIPGLKLDIVGDGDDLLLCKHEAQILGVADRVLFHGRQSRSKVDEFYAKADVFLFPSFREPSGNVVLEAMSYGLAMVVANAGGPAFVVDESCGIRVAAHDPGQFARGLADAIRKLAMDRDLLAKMSKAAREKIAKQYLWNVKINRLMEIYTEVVAGKNKSVHEPRRPAFAEMR